MIPLMMESGYKPNGWLGLILGCKLWFSFHHEAVETDATFTTQMDLVERELAGRGQPTTRSTASRVSEGVPPSLEPEPEPSPAPAPAASARAPAPAPAPAARLTLRPAPAPAPAPPTSAGAGSIVARPAIDDRSMSGFSPSVAGGDSFSRNTEMIPQQASSNATSEVSALIIEQVREQAREIGKLRAEAAAVERSSRAREKKEGVSDKQLAELERPRAFARRGLCTDFAELQSMDAMDLRDPIPSRPICTTIATDLRAGRRSVEAAQAGGAFGKD
eukprot:COSAG06_NODE_17904_length_915_cov_0.859069_1_plen_274_part_10